MSASPPAPRRASLEHGNKAAPWHTALLVSLMLAVAVTGALSSRAEAPLPPRPDTRILLASVYFPMALVQCGLALYVCRVGRGRSRLRELLGESPRTARRLAADCALALVGWVAIHAIDAAWMSLTRGAPAPSSLLPGNGVERLGWAAVALSAGFCEEVVYRGYLQSQLAWFTRREGAGILLQALLFGIAHGEQGGAAALRSVVYGVLFGVVARWRRSLWPGIVCHVAIDLTSGFIHA